MRLRMRCGSAFSLGDLQWCMVHVPDHVHLVGDLAGHVSRLLELNLRGGGAELPQLLLDGFLIPHNEDVRQVLRDDEVVDVEPSDGAVSWSSQALALAPASSGKRSAAAANGSTANGGAGAADLQRASKKPRQAADAGAVMAIGWQPPEGHAAPAAAAAAAAPPAKPAGTAAAGGGGGAGGKKAAGKAAPKVKATKPETSSEEGSSSEEESEDESDDKKSKGAAAGSTGTVARSRGGARGGCFGGGRGRGQDEAASAAAAAQATALATCGKGAGRSAGAGRDDEGRGLFVGGLPANMDSEGLRKHFQYYGAVEEASVVMNERTGKTKGFGFVEFADSRSRDKVIADGPTQEIAGKKVEVKVRTPKGGKGQKGDAGKGGGKASKGEGKAGKAGKPGKGEGARQDKEAAAAPPMPLGDEEAEMQRQMAALGLPVAFTASIDAAGGESDEDDDDEDEEEDE